MSGSLTDQIKPVTTLYEYQRAEWFAGQSERLAAAADRLHDQLLKVSLACGFRPGREHSHLTTLSWAEGHARKVAETFPRALAEVAQDNQQRRRTA